MATTGIKFDDGSGGFASSCFPVRGLMRQTEDGSGAWLVAARAEQRRRFKAVICAKPRDFEAIRQERKRAEKEGTAIVPPALYGEGEDEDEAKVLDGFFLMKHCCVDDPSDLCSVNISGQSFTDVKEEDFALFDNVAYVNASENFLPLESFTHFPIIRELEMPLNGLMGVSLKLGDFISLELLDLSYNNMMPNDLLPLGILPKLRVLHLTGNGLHTLPPELSRPHIEQLKQGNRKINRFPALEILLLDDNKLSDLASFAALAGLRNLKHLNMSKNEISSVPQLLLVEGRHVTQEFDSTEVRRHKSGRKSGRKSRARSSRMASRASTAASKKSNKSADVKSDVPGPQNTQRTTDTGPGSNVNPASRENTGDQKDTVVVNPQTVPEVPNETSTRETSMAVEISFTTRTDLNSTQPPTTGNTEQQADKSKANTQSELIPEQTDTSLVQSPAPTQNETENKVPQNNDTKSEAENVQQNESESKVQNETETAEIPGSEDEAVDEKKESNESLFDLDGALEELNLDKIDEKVEQTIVEERAADEEERRRQELADSLSRMSAFKEYDGDDALPPPFPELRFLDVSHNLIAEEEGLLAVAAWPMLSELLIHKNPLTTETTGDPPLLKRFLHDRLGIHLQRKEPGAIPKPHIEVQRKPERTVNTKIYPVPRIDVDALLAIEAPKTPSKPATISEKTEPRTDSAQTTSTPVGGSVGFDASKPLPPIPPTPEGDSEDDAGYDADMGSEQGDDAFFMTAVGDQEEEQSSRTKSTKTKSTRSTKRRMQRPQQEQRPPSGRYKGYETLLDIDESQIQDTIPLPKDMSGNIRALQYALNHPLVFRENKVHLDKVQKPFKPYIKTELEASRSRKPRSQTVEEALATVRQRKTVEEEPLTHVLKDKKKYRKHFGNANNLLSEVQRRYNVVRASSMRDNKQLQEIMQDTIQSVTDNSESTGARAFPIEI